jgi:alkanesulfonate monooxygenase SsuD/methylene tetrahydromethanopterin reductase-like flavin-dependent oxidoreductase (luciferase family)
MDNKGDTAVQHAICFMPCGDLADVSAVTDLARLAEETGWDGVFLWDHILRAPSEPAEVADTTVALTAVALATSRVRFGPMVTPLPRRRPQKLARESVTLDRLSGGRLTVGIGLGVDAWGELSRFGDLADPIQRGDMLDEGVGLLAQLMSGAAVDHRGRYFQASDVQFVPGPVQPRIPIWMAAHGDRHLRPVRRAARYDGLYVIDNNPAVVSRIAGTIAEIRGGLTGFDLAVIVPSGTDTGPLSDAGATWAMHDVSPIGSAAALRSRIESGPGPA